MPNNNQQHCMTFKINEDGSHNAAEIADFVKADSWDVNGDKLTLFNLVLVGKAQFSAMNGEDIIISGLNCEQQIEQEIQSKNLNAPRLTPDHIDSVIQSVHYFTAAQGDAKSIEDRAFVNGSLNGAAMRPVPKALELLTFCVLVLKNGFTVTGESACASPENFDAEIGKKIAYDNAREKIWLLEGYLLKEKLNHQIKIQEHFASQGVDLDQPLDTKNLDDGKLRVGCPSSFGVSTLVYSESIPRDELSKKREYAHVLTQLLGLPNIDSGLRKKVEAKMTALLDELI